MQANALTACRREHMIRSFRLTALSSVDRRDPSSPRPLNVRQACGQNRDCGAQLQNEEFGRPRFPKPFLCCLVLEFIEPPGDQVGPFRRNTRQILDHIGRVRPAAQRFQTGDQIDSRFAISRQRVQEQPGSRVIVVLQNPRGVNGFRCCRLQRHVSDIQLATHLVFELRDVVDHSQVRLHNSLITWKRRFRRVRTKKQVAVETVACRFLLPLQQECPGCRSHTPRSTLGVSQDNPNGAGAGRSRAVLYFHVRLIDAGRCPFQIPAHFPPLAPNRAGRHHPGVSQCFCRLVRDPCLEHHASVRRHNGRFRAACDRHRALRGHTAPSLWLGSGQKILTRSRSQEKGKKHYTNSLDVLRRVAFLSRLVANPCPDPFNEEHCHQRSADDYHSVGGRQGHVLLVKESPDAERNNDRCQHCRSGLHGGTPLPAGTRLVGTSDKVIRYPPFFILIQHRDYELNSGFEVLEGTRVPNGYIVPRWHVGWIRHQIRFRYLP